MDVALSNGVIAAFLHHTAVEKSAVYDKELSVVIRVVFLITTLSQISVTNNDDITKLKKNIFFTSPLRNREKVSLALL